MGDVGSWQYGSVAGAGVPLCRFIEDIIYSVEAALVKDHASN
jgi:hypothetical protein